MNPKPKDQYKGFDAFLDQFKKDVGKRIEFSGLLPSELDKLALIAWRVFNKK